MGQWGELTAGFKLAISNRIAIFNFSWWFKGPFAVPNVKDMPRKYSGILRTLCNPSIIRTLIYSKPWQIQNQRHMQNPGKGIFGALGYSTQDKFRTLSKFKMKCHAKIVISYSCFCKLQLFFQYQLFTFLLF